MVSKKRYYCCMHAKYKSYNPFLRNLSLESNSGLFLAGCFSYTSFATYLSNRLFYSCPRLG